VTNTIGSIFLFSGGLGTALFPLLISIIDICKMPLIIVYLSLGCVQLVVVLYATLHMITHIRSHQVDMIKDNYVKKGAILVGYKARAFSLASIVGHNNGHAIGYDYTSQNNNKLSRKK